jgi:hypothetical protein
LQCIAAALRHLRVLIRATASSMTLVFIRESGGAALDGVGMQWCGGLLLNALETQAEGGPAGITSEVTEVVEQ